MVIRRIVMAALVLCTVAVGCDRKSQAKNDAGLQNAASIPAPPDALPAAETGGFDSARAWEHAARLVAIGPRYPGSEGSRKAQEYIRTQLRSYGCTVEEDEFTAQTPQGPVRMRNLVAKIAGQKQEIVLLGSHYDTVVASRLPGFVGAVDGASGNAVMLELARLLCGKERKTELTVWVVFFDGEEAFVEWSETDSTYGSRQMAARMALAGDLPRVKAMILADLVGEKGAKFKREQHSTVWLAALVWEVAAKLGYGETFVDEDVPAIDDDHLPFLRRKVPVVDIVDLEYDYWHTRQDTLDKMSARALGVTGHVILESFAALEKRFK